MNSEAINDANGGAPPSYAVASALRPTVRAATQADAAAISAIHDYYAEHTTAVSHTFTQNEKDIGRLLKDIQGYRILPFLVATVTLDSAPYAAANNASSGNGVATISLPLGRAEHKAGQRVVGYALTRSHKISEPQGVTIYGCNAELFVYVAPAFVGRGIGRALINALLTDLRGSLYIPEDKRLLPLDDQIRAGQPRWRYLLAVMPVRCSGSEPGGEPALTTTEDLAVMGPMTAEAQRQVWQRFGFTEAGRFSQIALRNGRFFDEWYWQMRV